VLAFIAKEISPNTYLNLMDQYRPCYRADEHPPLGSVNHGRRIRFGFRYGKPLRTAAFRSTAARRPTRLMTGKYY
jgi:hypothetical protein